MLDSRLLGTIQSPHDERDWIAESIIPRDAKVDGTLDLRDELRPIRDQAAQGSCAAQTAACMKEWQEYHDLNVQEHFSPQFVYNLRENKDSGMYPRDVMKILYNIGICREYDYLYGRIEPAEAIPDYLFEYAQSTRIKGYARVTTVEGLKKALNRNGPCFIAFPVYNYGPRMWMPEIGEEYLGGHAVTVVGYTKEGFIIRNSWGADWQSEGYTIYPFSDWGCHWEIWTTVDERTSSPTEFTWWEKLLEILTKWL